MLTVWDPSLFDGMFQSMGVNQMKNEDGSLSIEVDIPGIKESDINIHLSDDNVVTVSGERKTPTSKYSVNKSFSLPDNCDSESLSAELKDGVLKLSLQLKQLPESKTPKRIPITTK